MEKRNRAVGILLLSLLILSAVIVWVVGQQREKPPVSVKTPAVTPKYTPYPQAKKVNDPLFSVRMQDSADSPTYVFRFFTIGSLVQEGNTLKGQGFFPWDGKRRVIPFEKTGSNGNYIMGICLGALTDYANRIETLPFDQISTRTPHGSMIQLKISAAAQTPADREKLKTVFEAAKRTEWNFDGLILHPFEIDIIER